MEYPGATLRARVLDCLVTLEQIAERTEATNGAVKNWITRRDDFPQAVLGEPGTKGRWYWWPDVEAYCKKNNLPRWRRKTKTDAMP